jgi:RimJ/RimL family protein N-acetyltransferase
MTSERLSYVRIRASHASALADALCDPRVYEFIDMACPTPSELLESFGRKESGAPAARADESWFDYAVYRTADGRFIGRVEATLIGRNAEVAYLFGPAFWGQGYAQESLGWLHSILAEHFGATDFWAAIHPSNRRSIRLVERLGYREAPQLTWPKLTSYDPGDRVFHSAPDAKRDRGNNLVRNQTR